MAFLVRRPGAYSVLVDAGRAGRQHLGVPRGGPADAASWQLGKALVGNEPAGAALEIALHGPTLAATARHRLVVFGTPFVVRVRRPGADALEQIPPGHVFTVDVDDEVEIPRTVEERGLRAYVCVQDGFKSDLVLGSVTTAEPLKVSHRLECSESKSQTPPRWVHLEPWADAAKRGVLRMMAGSHLTRSLRKILLATTFTVSPDSNRMGLRLKSKVDWPVSAKELVSAPVVPGTVQLPAGGQPIILGVDAQTIGGYPRLGHVIAADLDRVGQLRPGDHVHFEMVELATADALRESHDRWLRTWLQRIQHA
jgi:5-oxoprolinase (ATP-hydrolysing) subunit C